MLHSRIIPRDVRFHLRVCMYVYVYVCACACACREKEGERGSLFRLPIGIPISIVRQITRTRISPAIVVSVVSESGQIFGLMLTNYGIYDQLRR